MGVHWLTECESIENYVFLFPCSFRWHCPTVSSNANSIAYNVNQPVRPTTASFRATLMHTHALHLWSGGGGYRCCGLLRTPCSTCCEMLLLYFSPSVESRQMGLVCVPSVSFMHVTWEFPGKKLKGRGAFPLLGLQPVSLVWLMRCTVGLVT